MLIKKCLVTLSLVFSASVAIAAPQATHPCGAHTWHHISAKQGKWHGTLTTINQKLDLVDANCHSLSQFDLTTDAKPEYGMVLQPGDDFDVAYILTLVQQPDSSSAKNLAAKTCVYVVSAYGPARPQILVNAYNGADCNWKTVVGQGEDFSVG